MAKSEVWVELRRNLEKQKKGKPLTPSAAGRRVRADVRKADAAEHVKFAAASKADAEQQRQFVDEMVAAEPPVT